MSSMKPRDRIPAAERREQILDAAAQVFGELGYGGATTDTIARAAGISQPYVVRLFGSKENLIVEVIERTCDRVMATFREAIALDDDPETLPRRIGGAYIGLVSDRGILLTLMQAFGAGHDPKIGPVARIGLMRIYDQLREEAGFSAEQTREFLAQGMLINTLIGSGLSAQLDTDARVAELFECTFQDKLPLVRAGMSLAAR